MANALPRGLYTALATQESGLEGAEFLPRAPVPDFGQPVMSRRCELRSIAAPRHRVGAAGVLTDEREVCRIAVIVDQEDRPFHRHRGEFGRIGRPREIDDVVA